MVDIFGREVQRGDIIVFSDNNTSRYSYYKSARLGIVSNVLGKRVFKRGSSYHTKLLKRLNEGSSSIIHNLPDEVELQPVVTFIQFFETDNPKSLLFRCRKNGKPRRSVNMTTQFLIVDKNTLSAPWLQAYESVKQAFRL